MTETPIASYTFLPFARQGLGARVQEADGAHVPGTRASIPVSLTINADRLDGTSATESVPRNVELYGPGDITGCERVAVVRTEPRAGVTNFEANYLPFVEFYDEDFLWRYTPSATFDGNRRLRPWLTLLVLAEGEFEEQGVPPGAKLPAVQVLKPGLYPEFPTIWAWAHVHTNAALGGNPADHQSNAVRLGDLVAANRDRAYSRLLSSRVLQPNTGYTAFVIPTFESGRLAGLKRNVSSAGFPTRPAWEDGQDDLHPIYHQWSFRTGDVGDFEYLVRLLEPQTVDPQVGHRPIDTMDPGANLPSIPGLGGFLRLGGALRAPLITLGDEDLEEYNDFENWPEPRPHVFQKNMAALVNLARDYADKSAEDANDDAEIAAIAGETDPLIVPPLYGRWHAQVSKLDADRADPELDHWVDELNLDPRHRVAAGLGTSVVHKNQEAYMEAAWQQVGKVLEANSRIRFGHMALLSSLVLHKYRLGKLTASSDDRLLTITAPVQRRIIASGKTIGFTMRQSTVPPTLIGTTMRTALRPRARIAGLGKFTAARPVNKLIDRVNSGEVSAAPPKTVPESLPTGHGIADALGGGAALPDWLRDLLKRVPLWPVWLLLAAFVIAALCLLIPAVGWAVAVVVLLAAVALFVWLRSRLDKPSAPSEVIDDETRTPGAVDELPSSGSFDIPAPTTGSLPPPTHTGASGADSATARRFKDALRNTYAVDVADRAIPVRVRRPLDLTAIRAAAYAGIDPVVTVPRHVRAGIDIPDRIADLLVDEFGEVMVYPEIDDPMYDPLTDMSSEYFLPNIQLLPFNSITLLETNQKFIEAYMVGLNHEFARELLWREYPTDQRGSYFRQFWDVSTFLTNPGADPAALRERLFDIPRLHRWSTDSGLDEHDNREEQGDKEDELVLAIRGELLKKYPTAVVYAHRAEWQRRNGAIDKSKPRTLVDLPAGVPSTSAVKTPLYEAKVPPDIYFFGFDLTADEALGGPPPGGGEEDPGWFFVIKERPGEPRFGLDVEREGAAVTAVGTWNELSWTDVVTDYATAEHLPLGQHTVSVRTTGIDPVQQEQNTEDKAFRWAADTDAAELAYILYQLPVMMAVHAAEMLEKGGD